MVADFLSKTHEPTQRVRCPVHGFIHYSASERKIIDHWTFQRLRHIRQLAMTYLVYPGAMHSRFEHSLGVMELATRAFDAVVLKHRSEVESELKKVPELKTKTLAKARQTLRLMALLHDVGHPAFSHAAESTIPGQDHEAVSVYVMKEILGKVLETQFFPGMSALLVRLMQKSPELVFLREFVASQMDMDRTDYLRRDSLHCGVDYGVFDASRLIESLTVVRNPDSGRLQLALMRGGEHSFEALILARYQMNTQVYFHRIRRIYDYYLTEYMKHWGAQHHMTIDDVLRYDDTAVMADIKLDAEKKDKSMRSEWAARIINRRHHRVVSETGDYADDQALKTKGRVLLHLQKSFPKVSFYLDDAAHDIHKLPIPGDQIASKVEDLFIVDKNGSRKRLAQESGIIGKIPKRVRTVRIFADAEESKLKQIGESARQFEKDEQ